MSTKGLSGIEALRKGLHEHAEEMKQKADATMAEVIETEKQKAADLEAADIMRRRLEQEADDKLEKLDHVARQRGYIAFGVRPEEPSQPEPEPQAPAQPAPVAQDNDSNDAGNPPTAPLSPVPPADDNPSPRGWRRLDPRDWSRCGRILAIVLAALFAWVAYKVGLPADDPSLQSVVTVLWTGGWGLIGGAIGGVLGSSFDQE
jgi:hypothetical protein